MIFIFLSRFFPNSMWSSCLLLTLHNMSHLSLKLRFYIYPINNSWQLFLEVYFPLIYDFIAFHKNQNLAISEIHQFKMTRKDSAISVEEDRSKACVGHHAKKHHDRQHKALWKSDISFAQNFVVGLFDKKAQAAFTCVFQNYLQGAFPAWRCSILPLKTSGLRILLIHSLSQFCTPLIRTFSQDL